MSKLSQYFMDIKRLDIEDINLKIRYHFLESNIRNKEAIINPSEVSRYYQNGFLLIDGVISDSIIQESNKACNKLEDIVSQEIYSYEDFNLESKEGGWYSQDGMTKCFQGQIRKVKNIIDHSECFKKIAINFKILSIVYSLLEADFKLHSKGFLMNKPSRVSSEKKWHQDSAYFPEQQEYILTVWIPLQYVNEDNGCIYVLKESHKLGAIEHIGEEAHLDVKNLENANFFPCIMKAGSIAIFDQNTIHFSGINKTNKPRRALLFRYQR